MNYLQPWSTDYKKFAITNGQSDGSARKHTFTKFIDKVQRSRDKNEVI